MATPMIQSAAAQFVIGRSTIRPYVTALILEDRLAGTGQPPLTPRALLAQVTPPVGRWRGVAQASLPPLEGFVEESDETPELAWEVEVFRIEVEPSWVAPGTGLVDVVHQLVAITTFGRLVAIHGSAELRDAVRSAIRKGSLGRLQQVSPALLQSALVAGDATNMHLSATHRRQRTKADTKVLGGPAVQETLVHLEDSSFYLAATRVSSAPGLPDGTGAGVSPSKSSVWLRRSSSFGDFEHLIGCVLREVEQAYSSPPRPSAYPVLAMPLESMEGVSGPFATHAVAPWELMADVSAMAVAASEVLADVEFEVDSASNGVDLKARALRGARVVLDCVGRFHRVGHEVRLCFEDFVCSDPVEAAPVREALKCKELLSVHFSSGATWRDDMVFGSEVPDIRFANWRWADFSGVDVTCEKPGGAAFDPALIGAPEDDSLFGWVVREWGRDGYVTCDDGSNEIADFVAVDGAGHVTVIHVKAAGSARRRRISAQPYELVTAQATRNLRRCRVPEIAAHLARRVDRGTWLYGERLTDGRTDMIEWMSGFDAARPVDVVIVQPHVTSDVYKVAGETTGAENLRLRMLDSLLHSTRSQVIGLGGDLAVYGATA